VGAISNLLESRNGKPSKHGHTPSKKLRHKKKSATRRN
jgi:hypothetical protein